MLGILESATPKEVIDLFDQMCNNYIDIYTGSLTPETIGNEVISILKSKKALGKGDFTRWIGTKNGYRKIVLKDRSEWIVRESNEIERYVHIHPAKISSATVRYKGSTLKTAFLLKTSFPSVQETFSLEKVNQIRIQIGLSTVKKVERGKGILNCCAKFFVQD